LSVEHCVIRNCAGYDGYGFYGVTAHATLINNGFRDNGTGIYFYDTTSPVIDSGNIITGNERGIYFRNCISPEVASGTFISDHTDYGIYYDNCYSVGTIDNLDLTGNGGYGAFLFVNSGEFTLGVGNTIGGTGNENEWPLSIDVGSFPGSSSVIPTSGNTNSHIRVISGTGTEVGTWHAFPSINYIVTASPVIGGYGSLTVAAGNTVRFDEGTHMYVYGTLNAFGTVNDSVNFTRNGAGVTWFGIQYYNGASGDLDYCTIEYASGYPIAYGVQALAVDTLSLDHCVVQNNAGWNGYGVHFRCTNVMLTDNIIRNSGTGVFAELNPAPVFINNQIVLNNGVGIYLADGCAPRFGSSLSEWNDIYGNGTWDLYNSTADITAEYVYWGCTEYSIISTRIYDKCENLSMGIVDFVPFTNELHDTGFYPNPCPENLVIEAECDSLGCDSLFLSWCPVPNAIYYTVYSSDNPDSSFQQDLSGTYSGHTWSAPMPMDGSRFYYVTAETAATE
jgi:parallel beta-helix repeat protein